MNESILKISPSQIEKFRRCKKVYAFEYVEGFYPEPTEKQSFGSAIHMILQSYLSVKNDYILTTDEQKAQLAIAQQGLQWLPWPDPRLLVEHKFEFKAVSNIWFHGYIDCVVPPELTEDDIPIVIDHKITSNLKWAKSSDDLATDPQALIYSIWAMFQYNIPRVRVRWVYYAATNPKSGPRQPKGSKPVEREFFAKDANFLAQVEQLLVDADKMAQIRRQDTQASFLQASPHSCATFGGCPHTERCDVSPIDVLGNRIDDYIKKKKQDDVFMEIIRQNKIVNFETYKPY